MIRKYYFRIAIRNILRNKLYSIINFSGLAVGITAFLLIHMFVKYEKSYDTYHKDSDRIYRLRYERSDADGESVKFASCCPPAALWIRESSPDIENIARLFRYRATVICGEKTFYEERMFFAEPQIFDVLNIDLVSGDPVSGIKNANCAFISQSCASRYFGDSDPLGKTITVDKEMSFVVNGIFRDLPDNSHIDIDIMLSWPNLLTHYGADIEESWGDTGFFTYILLKPGVDPSEFEEKLRLIVENKIGGYLKEYKLKLDLKVQPLEEIHLNSAYMQELKTNGNKDTVFILSVIAIFIIVIAWVNYINITTARSLTRAKEVGLNKVSGAFRTQLMLQFFIETVMLNIAAFALSIILILLLTPFFCNLTGIPGDYVIWKEPSFIRAVLLLFISGVFFSGLYPVFVLTSFNTSDVLRGKYLHSRRGIMVRKMLVTFQLIMAISLVTCTLLVFRQVQFLKGQDTGINVSDVLVVRAPRVRDAAFGSKLLAFKEELLRGKTVVKFSLGTEVPGRQILWDAGGIGRVGSDQGKNYQIIGTDYDYLDLLEADIIAGRNFNSSFSDSSSLILNVKATKWMGFDTPQEAVNQKVDYWGEIYNIVGVVEDYHQQSPKEVTEPHIFRFMPHGRDVRGYFMMKFLPGQEKVVLELAGKYYHEFFPDNPFDYFFLEDYYEQQYRNEKLLGTVFGIFAILSVFVTCLGIFGLTSFLMLQKTKEISIRKVLGSDIVSIIRLYSKEFLSITIIAFIISLPLCYYWIKNWLSTFETGIDLNVLNFFVPLILTLIFILLTVSFVVYKTASMNPAENLRSE